MCTTQVTHDTARQQLAQYAQWVAWFLDGKQKRPLSPNTFQFASVTTPTDWGSYEDALTAAGADTNRIGFVLTAKLKLCCVDLDQCILDGEVLPWALEIVEALNSYTEVSPSGTGLHVWVWGEKPGTRSSRDYESGKVEIFDRNRFVTFTRMQFGDISTIEHRQRELDNLYNRLFPSTDNERINTVGGAGGFTGEDAQLLEKARKAHGTGELFTRLYDYGTWYGKYKSQSEADMALCGMLAYWTGRDEERMDRLFRDSALARKLDRKPDPDDYLDRTIAKAIENCDKVYDPKYKSANDNVRQMLEGCMERVVRDAWKGRTGPTDRDVYRAMINTGLMHGKATADGVIVSASVRSIALTAGIQIKAARHSLQRLERERKLIRKLDDGDGRRAATYLIKGAQADHINNCVNSYGVTLRATGRIRNPSRYYDTIGKRRAQIIEHVHALGRVARVEEVAQLLGTRARDVRRRYIPLLLELELLEAVDGGYRTPGDIEQRLERLLEDSGMADAERLQAKQYELEREVWRSGARELELVRELEAMREQRQAQKPVLIPSPPVNDVSAVERTCHIVDGVVHHTDPLCDDDCIYSFGYKANGSKELVA